MCAHVRLCVCVSVFVCVKEWAASDCTVWDHMHRHTHAHKHVHTYKDTLIQDGEAILILEEKKNTLPSVNINSDSWLAPRSGTSLTFPRPLAI